MDKITVDKSKPAQGDYNDIEAFKKTQNRKADFKLDKEKLINFTEIYKNRKKFVPGSGHYKYDISKVFSKLSKSPIACRVYRH